MDQRENFQQAIADFKKLRETVDQVLEDADNPQAVAMIRGILPDLDAGFVELQQTLPEIFDQMDADRAELERQTAVLDEQFAEAEAKADAEPEPAPAPAPPPAQDPSYVKTLRQELLDRFSIRPTGAPPAAVGAGMNPMDAATRVVNAAGTTAAAASLGAGVFRPSLTSSAPPAPVVNYSSLNDVDLSAASPPPPRPAPSPRPAPPPPAKKVPSKPTLKPPSASPPSGPDNFGTLNDG